MVNFYRLLAHVKGVIKKTFYKKDLDDLRYFLGIDFITMIEGVCMSLRQYVLHMFYSKCGMDLFKTILDLEIKTKS